MNDRSQRFRRLGPRTGDLFEHYGVPTAPRHADHGDEPGPPLVAVACKHCGWYQDARSEAPCPVCGTARARP